MKHKKAVIGISGSWMKDSGGMFPGYARAYVNHDYIRSVTENGGIPLQLPFVEGEHSHEIVEYWISQVDALILSGGHDLYPPFWGMEAQAKLGEVWPERDLFDLSLLKEAIRQGKPVLGICRGYQLIVAYHGGQLLQDLGYADRPLLKHWQGHSPSMPIHNVHFEEGTPFHAIFGSDHMTNSFHHQVVMAAGPNLTPAAHTSDGVVEAVYSIDKKIWGVQWHPEMMSGTDLKTKEFFATFIEWARENRVEG